MTATMSTTKSSTTTTSSSTKMEIDQTSNKNDGKLSTVPALIKHNEKMNSFDDDEDDEDVDDDDDDDEDEIDDEDEFPAEYDDEEEEDEMTTNSITKPPSLIKPFNNNDDHIKVITDETHGCLE